jgi:UDP-N-acetylglucosamine--N-acetylmuramyl-(pentapeptide) pyrophosphoryl-undecaprenol N-acetylglucosamine transferase
MKKFHPDVALGTRRYVSVPVVYAATRLNISTIIHEQNRVPGIANKFLATVVNKVAISFKGTEKYFMKEKWCQLVIRGRKK